MWPRSLRTVIFPQSFLYADSGTGLFAQFKPDSLGLRVQQRSTDQQAASDYQIEKF
jgi:hypothetical protein